MCVCMFKLVSGVCGSQAQGEGAVRVCLKERGQDVLVLQKVVSDRASPQTAGGVKEDDSDRREYFPAQGEGAVRVCLKERGQDVLVLQKVVSDRASPQTAGGVKEDDSDR
ncbi:rap guanine nucleotide exchange factor 5 isoform X1, partial [Tachysurus ichikawai]